MKYLLFALLLFTAAAPALRAQNLPDYYDPYAVYREGVYLFDQQKYSAAQEKFERYQKLAGGFSQSPQHRLQMADAQYYHALCAYNLLRSNAPALLNEFARQNPDHSKCAVARYYLGKLLFIKKDYKNAPEHLEKVQPDLLSEADYLESQFMLGYSYYVTDQKEKAANTFAPICDKLGEYHNKANYYYGVVQYERAQYPEALKAFTNIEKSEEYVEKVPVFIVGCLIGMEDFAGLEAYGKQLMAGEQKVDQQSAIYRQIAASLYNLNEYAKAVPFFEQFLKANSYLDRSSIYSFGFCHYSLKDYPAAILQFKKLIAGNDTVAQLAAYYVGFCYFNQEKPADAQTAFARAKTLKFVPTITKDAAYHYAKAAFEAKNLKESYEALVAYAEAYPDEERTNEVRALIGEVLLAGKKFRQAIEYFEASGMKDDRAQEAYQKASYFYATELFAAKKYDEADKYFEKAQNAPFDRETGVEARFWRAEIAFAQDKTGLAKQRYEAFLAAKGAGNSDNFLAAKLGVGWCFLKEKDYENAADIFQEIMEYPAAKKQPAILADAAIRAADCRFVTKKYDAASDLYSKVISGGKGALDYAYYQRGLCRVRLVQKQLAVKDFTEVKERFPKSDYADNALYELANANLKWYSDNAKTHQFAQQLVSEYPQSEMTPAAYNLMAYAANNSGDSEAAIKYFKKTLFDFGSNAETAQTAADELVLLVQPVEYAEMIKQYKSKFPDARLRLENMACNIGRDLLLVDQNYGEAILQLTECLSNAPDQDVYFESLLYRAEAYLKTDQKDKAIADYERVYQNKAPNEFAVKAYCGAADVHFRRNQFDRSLELYNAARAMADNNVDQLTVQFGLSKIFLAKHDYEQAKTTLRAVLENPKTTNYSRYRAMVQLGNTYYAAGDLDSAKALFASVENDSKTAFGAESQYMLVKILFDEGNHDECKSAVLYMTEQYKAYNDWKARAFIVMAENYFEQGEKEQAFETLKSVVTNAPDADIKAEAEMMKVKLGKKKPGKKKPKVEEEKPEVKPETTETSMKTE